MKRPLSEKIRRATWILAQRLTKHPEVNGVPISDLFIWRNTSSWQTYFELLDLPNLICDTFTVSSVHLVIFDDLGSLISHHTLQARQDQRLTISISTFLGNHSGEIGTFCVFHSQTPEPYSSSQSFLTERGYVSYSSDKSPLRSYVHGNFDAVALLPDYRYQLLGGISLRKRFYNLQYCFKPPSKYDIFIVNPSDRLLEIEFIHTSPSGLVKSSSINKINSFGLSSFSMNPDFNDYVSIKSSLAMSRPIVFASHSANFDVFHG